MKWLTVSIVLFSLLPFLPYFNFAAENELVIEINPNEVKSVEFPLGTAIQYIKTKGSIDVSMGGGIKNGERILILNIFSEKRTIVKIGYEVPSHPLFGADEHDFLIISPDSWIDLLMPLKDHKEEYGIKTIIVGLNEIYGGTYFPPHGKDSAEQIKYFIKSAIEEWGITYVMLVGGRKYAREEWLLPVRYSWLNDRSSSWEYERKFISDLYYADIYDAEAKFSSWDTNNNGYYGEYDHELQGKKLSDEIDLFPDVYIGRIPARSEKELQTVVENIMTYEKGFTAGQPRFKKVALCGGDLYLHDPWDVVEGEYLLEKIADEMDGYESVKLYASDGLSYRKINEVLNEGVGFVIFEGAGSHHLWATHAKDNQEWIYYYAWNIVQLKNNFLPIVLSSGAHLGQFNRSRECFNWLFVSKGKAVATIGSTGLCWIGHGENLTKMFLGKLHILLCREMAERNILGNAWGDALCNYLSEFSWHDVAKAFHMKAAEELEIFGDPTLKIGGYERVASALNNVLHVGGSGGGNYSKIRNAIENASNGDTIIVHSGVYEEDLLIDKSITLMGDNATIKTNGIIITASGVILERFSVEGYKEGCGIICYGNDIVIKDNEIYSFNKSIFVEEERCIIEGNRIKGNECGIWLNATDDIEVNGNVIKDNWYGVWGEYASNISIFSNNFSYNAWYALWMEGNNGIIEENNFSKNWYCIYFYNSNSFTINRNLIRANMHGPQFVNSIKNSIEGNTIERNEHYGIYFGWRSKENVVTKNNFIENAQNARDDAGNTWAENYWSDYFGVKIKLLWLLRIPYFIPQFSFDWHPQLYPYESVE